MRWESTLVPNGCGSPSYGHFDDPAADACLVAPGEPPQPIDDQVAKLYCRERFVVDSWAFG